MENRISIIVTDAQKNDILSKIKNVDGSMPWLITLDKGEVIGDLKLDKESIHYLDKTVNILNMIEGLLSNADKEEFIKDVNLYRNLMPILLAHDELGNRLRKTMVRVGQEINSAFREAYKVLKVRASHNSTYQTYLEELTPYFKKFGRKNGGSDTENPK